MTAGRQVISQSQEWCTPPKYTEAIKRFFGKQVDLDPCSNKYSIVNAKTEYRLPKNDGLKLSWNFETIYVNPPYGRAKDSEYSIYDWLEKCFEAYESYGSEVLALVPVATNTKHWKDFVFGKAAAVCFLSDTRLKFLVNGSVDNKGAPMSCCMIYWGKNLAKFQEIFTELGAVVPVKNAYDSGVKKQRASARKNIHHEFQLELQ